MSAAELLAASRLWGTVAGGFSTDPTAHKEMLDLSRDLKSAAESGDELDREFMVLRAQEMQRRYGGTIQKRFG